MSSHLGKMVTEYNFSELYMLSHAGRYQAMIPRKIMSGFRATVGQSTYFVQLVALQSLQVSCLSDMHSRFYESSKLKKWMCELCTFSQIQSHIQSSIQYSRSVRPR